MTCTSTTSASVTDGNPNSQPPATYSPYPDDNAVTGMSGTIATITVTLNGWGASFPVANGFMLVAPDGTHNLVFMSNTGGTGSKSGLTLTFDDASGNTVPDTGSTLASGTFKPRSLAPAPEFENSFPTPAPSTAIFSTPRGSGTLTSQFLGLNPNGTWHLYAVIDSPGDTGAISGWSLHITTNVSLSPTTTTLTPNPTEIFTTAPNNLTTLLANVSSGGNPVTTGTVTFTEGASVIASNVAVDGQGNASTATSFSTEGLHTLTATYNGTATLATSSGNATVFADKHTVVTGNQFCNPGSITIANNPGSSPYPSHIFVSGLGTALGNLTMALNSFSATFAPDVSMLLVDPNGLDYIPFSGVGTNSSATTNVNFTLSDSAASSLPQTALSSGTFRPTAYTVPVNGSSQKISFPAPAPAIPGPQGYPAAAPQGTSTLNGIFQGDNPNGMWSLYILSASTTGTLSGGWCLTVTPLTTVTNVTSSTANGTYGVGATISIQVTFSANVTVTGTPQLALNSGGTASYTSGSGTNTLTFTYTVATGQNSAKLDYTSTGALSLSGGTIKDGSNVNAVLTLPAPGATGSLGANKNIVIDTTAPTVVSYKVVWGTQSFNLIGSSRNRLPWQISAIQVVFSKPIASADMNSLTGLTTTGLSGLGTNTLTWSISPVSLGTFATALAGTGADAIKDAAGNPLAGGTGFSQNFKVLWGDVNDDGIVNIQDQVLVNSGRSQPYSIFNDMNGDGVVDVTDVSIVRGQNGHSLP
jgi:hypothetical protein